MNTQKSAFLALVLTVGLATPAGAQSIPGLPSLPTMPDMCLWSYCITYTQSAFYTQIQAFAAQIKNMTGLGSIPQLNPLTSLGALTAPPTAANPDISVNSATATLQQAPLSAATIQRINEDALASEGAHSDEQVANGYAAVTANAVLDGNIQHANEVKKADEDTKAKEAGLSVLFDGKGW